MCANSDMDGRGLKLRNITDNGQAFSSHTELGRLFDCARTGVIATLRGGVEISYSAGCVIVRGVEKCNTETGEQALRFHSRELASMIVSLKQMQVAYTQIASKKLIPSHLDTHN